MTLFLAGGGSPTQERLVWAEAFEGVTRVLYWPFALPHEHVRSAGVWFRHALKDLSIEAEVDSWESLDGHDRSALGPYDLLFVGGGSTSTLAEQVLRHDFVSAVFDFVAAGGRYCGGSAGALLACETLTIASLVDGDTRATGMRGLGLIENLSVFPHADTFPKNRPLEVARALGHDILALPEASGVAVEGGVLRPIGPDPVRLITNAGHDVREMRAGERAEARVRRPVSPDAGT